MNDSCLGIETVIIFIVSVIHNYHDGDISQLQTDIDECHNDNSTHNCSEVDNQVCRNTIGSFECDCVPGFQKQDGECEGIILQNNMHI